MLQIEQKKKPPFAIQYLKGLYQETASRQLTEDLRSFGTAKPHRFDVFIEGVLLFTKIANLSPDQRSKYYGNSFLGLHYNNDLAKGWNRSSPESINAHQLNFLCPPAWNYQLVGAFLTLVYRGDKPSTALDTLLQGPTVIDCGMFCQLGIWFGIKYMLGEKTFNAVFGKVPFYITQHVYNPTEPQNPYLGNPLYPFFQKPPSARNASKYPISIMHIPNHPLYPLKHPGGNYGGENCVVINNDEFIIFDPTLEKTSGLRKDDVEKLLLDTFNAQQDVNDDARLALYRENPTAINPTFGRSYEELITMAQSLACVEEKSIELDSQTNSPRVDFDFESFCSWVAEVQSPVISTIAYTPLPDEQLAPSKTLAAQIPFENRQQMSFSRFTVNTPTQEKTKMIAQQFCLDVMSGRSTYTILTGHPGVGKTAAAVCCARELSSRGKKVIWFSELMFRSWLDKAESIEGLEKYRDEIREQLASKPDAVFLDDDNLIDYAGQVLLEEFYRWYATTPGVGLFITSNEPITFKNCYGLKLDGKYDFPPFPGYVSPQYKNTKLFSDINGQSMRARPNFSIMALPTRDRITALTACRCEASVGIIIDATSYESEKHRLASAEFIPAFESLTPIRGSLRENGVFGPAYDALTPIQKEWLIQFQIPDPLLNGEDKPYHPGIAVKPFEKSASSIIVIELLNMTLFFNEKIIDPDCLQQLLRVINYAHDTGGKRIILLNNTLFSDAEMLSKIKEAIPEREKARTLARINALLFSPQLTVPDQKEPATPTAEATPSSFFWLPQTNPRPDIKLIKYPPKP